MDDDSLLRYSRQILLPEIDLEGQNRLRARSALILGLGGLGAPVATYLAAAGLSRLIICDDDRVDLSNLQRQPLYSTDDLGMLKTTAAARQLRRLNPEVTVEEVAERPDARTLENLLARVDIALDCTDNLASRHLLNRIAFQTRRPLVSGAAIRFEGQIAVFDPTNPQSPCYNCLYPEGSTPPARCAESGVVAPLPGIIGSLQALEAIKYLLAQERAMVGHLLVFDGWQMEWMKLALPKDPLCRVCRNPIASEQHEI